MKFALSAALAALCSAIAACADAEPADLSQLKLPPGFRIDVYADGVSGARELALGANGTVFVGSREPGKVHALIDADRDGRAERVVVVASGLEEPSGVAFRDGDLYIGAVSRIVRLPRIESHLDAPPKPDVVTDKLPHDRSHGWKFIAFGPDGRLYVPIGAPCNICDPGKDHAKLISMKPDGSDWQDVAYGIRNSVGFDWQPGTNELWFTDNGRDLLGDDLPSDELNRIARRGAHFGYPYCHQGDTPDPEFGKGKSCGDYTPPVLKLGAHVAAIGMRFYTGSMFPAEYRNAAIIAEHGSWNRSKKSGYRVMAVRLDGSRVVDYSPLVDGFERDERVTGRPADVLVMPDGALLVADEEADAVYRVSYAAPAASKH
ncbi:MAG TPA: PQQ-dependent sugar dehydrogenase [Rhodanobacteraceae bacterium]|nr:PQQ-dependent sugar dehydrogenase [Rhodanobacteraceae bacterium]